MTAPDLSGRKPSFGSGVTTPRSISAGRVPIADLGEPTPKPMAVWRANFYRFNRAKDQPPGTAELVAHTIPEFPSTRALWLPGVRQIVNGVVHRSREDRAVRAAQVAFDLHAPRRPKLGNFQKHSLLVQGERCLRDVQSVFID